MHRSARRLQSSAKEATLRNPSPVPRPPRVNRARQTRKAMVRPPQARPGEAPVTARKRPRIAPGAVVRSRKPCFGSAGGLARRGPGAPNLVYGLRHGGSRRTSDGGAAQRPRDGSSRRGHAPQGLLRHAGARWLSRHPILRRIRRRRGGPAWRCVRLPTPPIQWLSTQSSWGAAPPSANSRHILVGAGS